MRCTIFFFCFIFYCHTLELSYKELEDIIVTLSDEVKSIKKELDTQVEYNVDLRYKIIKS